MISLESAVSEPGPDLTMSSFDAALALALTRRSVAAPLLLSLVVAVAVVSSYLSLGVPFEGKAGEVLGSLSERFLGNAFSRAILVLFLAAAFYATLQFVGVTIDRDRLHHLGGTPSMAASRSWLALLSGRSFRPGVDADDRKADRATVVADDPHDAAERYGLQRRRYAELGLAPLRFAVWVLPLLGFIGTVVGIARSIGGLETVIGSGGGSLPSEGLMTVLDGLRFAFDTTLLGLVTVIPVMALLMILGGREDLLTEQGHDRVQALLAVSGMAHAQGGEHGAAVDVPDRVAARSDGLEG